MTDADDTDDSASSFKRARAHERAAVRHEGAAATAGERIDRREGDRDLIATLEACGFTGRDYDEVAAELARYAVNVLSAWCYRGEILWRAGQKTRFPLPSEPWADALLADVEDVVNDTIIDALEHFRSDVLIPGKWTPGGGASLKTYFIGQCLFRFCNVYKRWHRGASADFAHAGGDAAEFEEWLVDDRLRSPESVSADRDEVDRVLGPMPDKLQRAFVMHAVEGLSVEETADQLGMSPKTLSTQMRRARIKAIKERGTG